MALYKDKNGDLHDDMGGAARQHFPEQFGPYVQVTDVEAESIRAANALVPTYKDLRIAEYAKKSIGEQLDMQYRDMVNGTTLWRDWIASIKAQFPKA